MKRHAPQTSEAVLRMARRSPLRSDGTASQPVGEMMTCLPRVFVLLLIVLMAALHAASLRAQDIDWTRQFAVPGAADDRATASAFDTEGNIFVVGTTDGILPGQSTFEGTSFIRKYDSNGNEVWTRQFETGGVGDARAVSVDGSAVYVMNSRFLRRYDSNGNILWIRSFADVGVSTINGRGVSAQGGDNGAVYVGGSAILGGLPTGSTHAFIRKYDSDGNDVWTRTFRAGANDGASGVSTDASGIYVVGVTTGTLPGQTQVGKIDAFIRKYDADGNELWTRQFGSTQDDQATAVSVDASGIYVAGSTVFGTLPGQVGSGGVDAFIRKYAADGSELWTRQFAFGSSSSGTVPNAVSATSTGVYLGGRGPLDGVTFGSFIRKFNSEGDELWTRQSEEFGSPPGGLSADGNGVCIVGNVVRVPGGERDAIIQKRDTDGNELWTREFGAVGRPPGVEVTTALDANRNIYIAGSTDAALPGQSHVGEQDVFIRKFDPNGNELWVRQFGTALKDTASGLSVDGTGVYVIGVTDGAMPGQVSAGGTDIFLRK